MGNSTDRNMVLPPGIELYFTRHARSMENDGQIFIVDAPLSHEGRAQAALLSGHFDYVICSPMRRCQETLHYSGITYNEIHLEPNFRERVYTDSSRMMFEHGTMWEPEGAFAQRVTQFHENLKTWLLKWGGTPTVKRVLLVGHSYFFNYWTGRSRFSSVDNAAIIKLG